MQQIVLIIVVLPVSYKELQNKIDVESENVIFRLSLCKEERSFCLSHYCYEHSACL